MFEVLVGVAALFLIVSITYFYQLKTPYKEINFKESFREIFLIGTSIYVGFACFYFSYVHIFVYDSLAAKVSFIGLDVFLISYLVYYFKTKPRKKTVV